MRSIRLGALAGVGVTVVLGGCSVSQRGADVRSDAKPASSPAARPSLVAPEPAASRLNVLEASMTGVFSSAAQAKSDPEHFRNVRLVASRIWPERADGLWLYVEQALATDLAHPYRQRVYHITAEADGSLLSRMSALPGDPQRFADGSGRPFSAAALTPETLVARQGCDIVLRYENGAFVGQTQGAGCPSDVRGAAYATSQVRISPGEFVSWDRGFGPSGQQVWGPAKGGYVFKRVK